MERTFSLKSCSGRLSRILTQNQELKEYKKESIHSTHKKDYGIYDSSMMHK